LNSPKTPGRKKLPYDEMLVSQGFHLRRHRRRLLQACTVVTQEPQRVFFERLLEQEAKRLRSKGMPVDAALEKITKAEARV
jgi:hypothetical protein